MDNAQHIHQNKAAPALLLLKPGFVILCVWLFAPRTNQIPRRRR
jgi:hypothetical protein